MIVFCGYCKKFMEEAEPLENKKPTHGVCRECLPEFFREAGLQEDQIKGACKEIEDRISEREKKEGRR